MQVQRQIDKLLAQRAAEWMEALKAGGVRERREFAAWLRQSRLHVEHYLETAAIDREIAGLDASRCPDVDELIARATPHAEPLRSVPMPLVSSTRGETSQRRWKLGAGLAAAAALLAVGAMLFEAGVASQADRVSTVAGEQRTLTLEDGSVVALNTRTRLRIEFSAGERAFALEAGEAVFDVAQDPLRPFIVRTPTAVVRALGTQFNVYQRPNDTVVSVIEGRVQVMPLPKGGRRAAAGEVPARTLAAGEEALVAAAGDIEARTRPDVHKVLAWRQRRLDFDEVALEDIVREFNRYGPTERLRVEGIAPGARRYGGVFDADDPESFAQLLEREKDLRVERLDGEIVISRRR
jgi:transmembrane sensor